MWLSPDWGDEAARETLNPCPTCMVSRLHSLVTVATVDPVGRPRKRCRPFDEASRRPLRARALRKFKDRGRRAADLVVLAVSGCSPTPAASATNRNSRAGTGGAQVHDGTPDRASGCRLSAAHPCAHVRCGSPCPVCLRHAAVAVKPLLARDALPAPAAPQAGETGAALLTQVGCVWVPLTTGAISDSTCLRSSGAITPQSGW
jgi:hypothetical protein